MTLAGQPQQLAPKQVSQAQRRSLAPPRWQVDLVLIGARGRVGSALRRQLETRQAGLRDELGLDLRLRCALDRRGFAEFEPGLTAAELDSALQPRRPGDLEALLGRIEPGHALVLDCTASDTVADGYARWLQAGFGVVAANKHANARGLAFYRQLQAAAVAAGVPYRYETTVGAALPVLGPLRDLRLRGEAVLSIEGVLSGSLSFVLARIEAGSSLSEAVAEAGHLGYTEPDPREDLQALDVQRKLLITAREAGFALEQSQIEVEPLCRIEDPGAAALAAALQSQDAKWRARAAGAKAADCRLVMVAEADRHGGRIGVRELPATHPLAQLAPGENLLRLRTTLQDTVPLAIRGAGAGVEITAAGVLSDVIAAAAELRQRPALAPRVMQSR